MVCLGLCVRARPHVRVCVCACICNILDVCKIYVPDIRNRLHPCLLSLQSSDKKPHSFCTLHTLRQPQAHTSISNSRSKQRGWDKCVLSGLYVCTCLCECDDIITTAEHSIVDWWRKGCYGRLLRAQCPPARQLDLTTLCVCACVRACVCVSCSSCKMINRKDTLAICWKGKFVT